MTSAWRILTAPQADICTAALPERVYVITPLEVLEHILDVGAAIRQSTRLARR